MDNCGLLSIRPSIPSIYNGVLAFPQGEQRAEPESTGKEIPHLLFVLEFVHVSSVAFVFVCVRFLNNPPPLHTDFGVYSGLGL